LGIEQTEIISKREQKVKVKSGQFMRRFTLPWRGELRLGSVNSALGALTAERISKKLQEGFLSRKILEKIQKEVIIFA
jgi:hypothetical protein